MLALRIVTAILVVFLLIGAGLYIVSLRHQRAQQTADIKALQASSVLLAQQQDALTVDKIKINNENASLRTDIENAKQTSVCANSGAGGAFLNGVRVQQQQQPTTPAQSHYTTGTHNHATNPNR